MKKSLNSLDIYKISIALSRRVWEVYLSLPKDIKFSTGKQVLNAIDSIGANIAEGYGRFHYKDKIRFFYHARGSLWESKHWIYLLNQRGLIKRDDFIWFMQMLEKLGKKLNSFIAKTGQSNV